MKVDPRFLTSEGPEIFTGNELLLKGALETAGGVHLLGGYPGSPIAGLFDALPLVKDLLNEKGIRAVINNNEALAAAMLNGAQVAKCRGMIVMKSVGVHVAADALALGNLAGADPEGGAVVVYGDDPWSDSTQVAADSRYISRHLFIPVIEPANPQEIKDYIPLAFELSAASELYAGYVITTNLADGGGTVTCKPNQYPAFNTHQLKSLETAAINLNKYVLLPPKTWWQEENLADRFARAIAKARATGLNRIDYPASSRKAVGFVTSGLAHSYLVQALSEMGLLGEFPMLKFGMSYPVDGELVRELASQCERIVVVEERRGFLEEQIGEVILRDRQSGAPAGSVELWGKKFPGDLAGIPETRGLHSSILIELLVPLLKQVGGAGSGVSVPPAIDALDREIATIDTTERTDVGELPARIPTFCPGCPHRDSASVCLEIKKHFMDAEYMRRKHKRAPVDLMFHGDTGCYTMLMFPPNTSLMHDYSGMGLGAGTGSGVDPFVTNKQVVFMGDSTFFHSGQIAISQAIKLSQDITFIILDNSTTAMTGHQPTPGVDFDILGNPTAVQDIQDIISGQAGGNGVTVVRVDPEKRRDYSELLEKTFLADGVKVVIADKECGITRGRRKRRRDLAMVKRKGYLPTREHMNINPEICRFCLACIEATGCPGLKHVETEYGTKMDTDVTWCVNDGACERIGACSAFERVVVKRNKPPRSRVPELGLDKIPEPQKRPIGDLWRCALAGVGSQGIGTATSILVRAGHKEGYEVIFVDKKGLAIRNGGVFSQVVYNIAKEPITAVIPYGKADLLIGIDVLEAARALDPRGRSRVAAADQTAAVINTDKLATILGLMGQEDFGPSQLERLIRAHTRSDDFLARNISRISEKYLGSKIYTNIMMLGFAFQKGLIPVSMHSMAWAIKDTIRADFRKNLYAFNMGRKLCERMDIFQGPPRRRGWRKTLEEKCRFTIRRYGRGQNRAEKLRELAAGTIAGAGELDESLKEAIVVRMYDCMRWGGLAYARGYAERILEMYTRDKAELKYAATRAVIYNLAAAMLIKDPVFLAELSTSPEKYARDREKYSVNPANGDRILYHHLWHPEVRIAGRTVSFDMTVYDWMLRLLKRSRYLRKLFPRWSRQEKQFLRQYEVLLDAFAYDDDEEYHRRVRELSSPRCMNCMNPRCAEAGCPLASNIPDWLQLAYQQRWREASEKLHEYNNFPEFTSRTCPGFCRDACKQGINDFPVEVQDIERRIIDEAFEQKWVEPRPAMDKTGRRVAIVGSGPAGLAAAQQLARSGHTVTVFEKDDHLGGLLRYGIPGRRLDKSLIDRRLEQLTAEGIEFRTGVEVGRHVLASELKEKFDAVLLAVGASRPRDLKVPGRGQEGVHFAMDFLRRQNRRLAGEQEGESQSMDAAGKVVAVIGGGLTGADCVETAVAQGAREIHQFEILPSSAVAAEIEAHFPIEHEEVRRSWCVATKEFDGDGQHLRAVRAVRVQWVPSANGPVMKELPGSEFSTRADMALLALGYEAIVDNGLVRQLNLGTDDRGRAVIRDFATGAEGVFAAGDLVNGASYVATAIDSGRRAAEKINAYLARTSQPAETEATA